MSAALERTGVWIVAILLTPVLLFAFRDLWALQLLLFLFMLPRIAWEWRGRLPGWVLPLLALAGYGLVSIAWSASDRAATDAPYHAIFAVVTIGLFAAPPRKVSVLLVGAATALFLLAFENAAGEPLRGLAGSDLRPQKMAVAAGRGLALAIFFLPALILWSWRKNRRLLAIAALLAAAVGAATSPVLATGLGLAAALIAASVALVRPMAALVSTAFLLGLCLLLPFGLAALLPDSAGEDVAILPASGEHRLVIWRQVLDAWAAENPLFGAGARGTEALGDRAGTVLLGDGSIVSAVSVHPHNVFVQILYEYGLFGYALFSAAAVLAAKRLLDDRPATDVLAAVLGLAAYSGVLLLIEADIWNVYTLCGIALGGLAIRSVALDARP